MSNPLYYLKITDRQSFIKLLKDNFVTNPEVWENKTLPYFLEEVAINIENI